MHILSSLTPYKPVENECQNLTVMRYRASLFLSESSTKEASVLFFVVTALVFGNKQCTNTPTTDSMKQTR